MRKKRVTAAELMAQLESDPEWVARRDERERQRAERRATLRAAETDLLAALREVGIDVQSVWQLGDSANVHPAVIPILLDHLSRDYPSTIREGIARRLGVRAAKPLWSELVRRFIAETDPTVKCGLGATLHEIADRRNLDELIALTRDRRLGSSRVMLLRRMTRLLGGRKRARPVLLELQADSDLVVEVTAILEGRSPSE